MGWSAHDLSCENTNYANILKIANDNNLVEKGYNTIVLNDCWMRGERDSEGHLQVDSEALPKGMKNVSESFNKFGMKLGLTLSAGAKTCQNGKPGSLGFEAIDANDLKDWGVQYLMYEDCGNEANSSKIRFAAMRGAIERSNFNIFFATKEPHSHDSFSPSVANS